MYSMERREVLNNEFMAANRKWEREHTEIAQWAEAWKNTKNELSLVSITLSVLETREQIHFNKKEINSIAQF